MLDVNKILEETKNLPAYQGQIGLQSVIGNNDPFYATGRIGDKQHQEQDFTEYLFDMPYTNSILKEYKVYRARIMTLMPKSCYSYHRDYSKRLHIPLITNEKCFLIVDKEVIHLPADGKVHIIDTTLQHTAVNASTEPRTHLIGCLPT